MIDTHVHVHPGWRRDTVARELDGCKLDKVLLASLPLDHWRGAMVEEVAPLLAEFPDRLAGLIGIHPPDVEESLRRIKVYGDLKGFVGVKLMPTVGYYPDEERFRPIFDEIHRRKWIVMSHCGWCSKGVKPLDLPQSTRFTDPYHFEPLARIYPDTDFILAHAGGRTFFPRAWELTHYHDNVYIDTCPGQGTWALKHGGDWLSVLNWKNVLFGTDIALGAPDAVPGQDSVPRFQNVRRVLEETLIDKGFGDKVPAILHDNAARLLRKRGMAV